MYREEVLVGSAVLPADQRAFVRRWLPSHACAQLPTAPAARLAPSPRSELNQQHVPVVDG